MKPQSFAAATRGLALGALVLGVPTGIFANAETNRVLSIRAPAPSEYVLDVHLDPAAHRLSATARITVAVDGVSGPVTFLLNHQLDVTSVREAGQPVTFSRGTPDQESKPLLVELAPRSGKRSRDSDRIPGDDFAAGRKGP